MYESERPKLPSSGNPELDALMQEVISDALRSAETGQCSQCGSPIGEGTGSLCQECSDNALLDIALTLGVLEIWSEEWEDGYPTAAHPIWGVLVRTLERRNYGEPVEDLYPVLDQLGTLRTLGIVENRRRDFAVDIVDLPLVEDGKAWLFCRTTDNRAGIEEWATGAERLEELQETAIELGIPRELRSHQIPGVAPWWTLWKMMTSPPIRI